MSSPTSFLLQTGHFTLLAHSVWFGKVSLEVGFGAELLIPHKKPMSGPPGTRGRRIGLDAEDGALIELDMARSEVPELPPTLMDLARTFPPSSSSSCSRPRRLFILLPIGMQCHT